MSPIRGIGNLIVRTCFRILIGRGTTDLLSGYRTFNRRFRNSVRLQSNGFEIETEVAIEAVARRLRVVEVAGYLITRGLPALRASYVRFVMAGEF